MSDLSNRDQSVPVLLQMPHLYASGNVLCCKNPDHSGQRFCLFCVNKFYQSSWIGGTKSASVDHALLIDIVRILAIAQNLFTDIHPGHTLSQLPGILPLFGKSFSFIFCGKENTVYDFFVACTAADIVADRMSRLSAGRIRILVNKPLGADHHAGNTESALHCACFSERPVINLFFFLRKSFHSYNMPAFHHRKRRNAGLLRFPVDQYMTGSAGAFAASVFY